MAVIYEKPSMNTGTLSYCSISRLWTLKPIKNFLPPLTFTVYQCMNILKMCFSLSLYVYICVYIYICYYTNDNQTMIHNTTVGIYRGRGKITLTGKGI